MKRLTLILTLLLISSIPAAFSFPTVARIGDPLPVASPTPGPMEEACKRCCAEKLCTTKCDRDCGCCTAAGCKGK